jgi:hypothetical protein
MGILLNLCGVELNFQIRFLIPILVLVVHKKSGFE